VYGRKFDPVTDFGIVRIKGRYGRMLSQYGHSVIHGSMIVIANYTALSMVI
jgi:hypothetical protein